MSPDLPAEAYLGEVLQARLFQDWLAAFAHTDPVPQCTAPTWLALYLHEAAPPLQPVMVMAEEWDGRGSRPMVLAVTKHCARVAIPSWISGPLMVHHRTTDSFMTAEEFLQILRGH